MSVEQASFISQLVPTNPNIKDPVHNGPDHFWLLKNVLKSQFPGKEGSGFAQAIIANEEELNYVKGVRKSIQDQIDSLAAGQSDSAFEKGTTIVFAQPQAPTGWAQVTDGTLDNRMIRVVVGNGGAVGGNDSPIVNNFVPTHDHSYTTGASGGHGHTVTIANAAANHTHPISISGADTNHNHTFTTDVTDVNHTHSFQTGNAGSHQHVGALRPGQPGFKFGYSPSGQDVGYGLVDPNGDHTHGGTTGGANGGTSHSHGGATSGVQGSSTHTHSGTCQPSDSTHNHIATASTVENHTHSGVTDATGKEGGWRPRYIDTILAEKQGPKQPAEAA